MMKLHENKIFSDEFIRDWSEGKIVDVEKLYLFNEGRNNQFLEMCKDFIESVLEEEDEEDEENDWDVYFKKYNILNNWKSNIMNDQISFSSNRNSIQKFKVVLVGDQNVGKSSIIARYIRNEFDPTKNVSIFSCSPP